MYNSSESKYDLYLTVIMGNVLVEKVEVNKKRLILLSQGLESLPSELVGDDC